ncbi:hypothetical protein diail_9447 [Diaporthe ilicicola]|nr:hypothetical protein diail_9447 [Diaporthe ilicicola]
MASKRNPLRDLTPTESDLDNNTNGSSPATGQGEKLREKATKALHGPNANPSQLGDPISLKAEASDHIPKPDEAGAQSSSPAPPSSKSPSRQKGGGETLREKAAKKLHGPDANPSQLGDPISLKAEQSDNVPAPSEEGAHSGGSGGRQGGHKGRSSRL